MVTRGRGHSFDICYALDKWADELTIDISFIIR